jgi:hypothetical protein
MRLNLRPAKGWRAFAGEVGVIVLGVLIALAAQQAAESVNERREAADARAVVVGEIEESLTILKLRQSVQPCIDKRLQDVRAIVDQWGRTGSFTTPRWIGQAPWFVSTSVRLEAAQSAGRLALLPSQEQYRIGLVSSTLRNFREIQVAEMDAWAKLRMLQSGADALSASDRTAIRLALQEASLLNYRARVAAGNAIPFAASYGWRPNPRNLKVMMARAWKNGRFPGSPGEVTCGAPWMKTVSRPTLYPSGRSRTAHCLASRSNA